MTKFLLLFKLEYIKFINNIINTNKQNSLNPEKNANVGVDSAIQFKNKTKIITSSQEVSKEERKKEEKKENPRESSLLLKSEDTTPRQSESNISTSALNLTQNLKTGISYQPVEIFNNLF